MGHGSSASDRLPRCWTACPTASLDPPLPAERRLAWLARDPGGHPSQPYERLACQLPVPWQRRRRAQGSPGQAADPAIHAAVEA